MTEHYEETFFLVPTYIRKLPGITLGYLDVYNVMFQFWNKGRECFLSNKTFMERTGYTQQYLNDAFAYFEERGELKRITKNNKRYLVKPSKGVESDVEDNVGVQPQLYGGTTTVVGGVQPQLLADATKTPLQPTPPEASKDSAETLNKEVLNKEIKRTTTSEVVVLIYNLGKQLGMSQCALDSLLETYEENTLHQQLRNLSLCSGVANKMGWLKAALKNNYQATEKRKVVAPASHELWSEAKYERETKIAQEMTDPNDWREQAIQQRLAEHMSH